MNYPLTDITVGICLLLLTLNGASQGFLRSTVGPASMLLSSLLAWLVFVKTQHIGTALLVGLLGPFILGQILNLLIQLMASKEAPVPSLISRIGGALLNLSWGVPLLAGGIVLLAILPIEHPTLTSIRMDISKSVTYKTLSQLLHLPDPQQKTKPITPPPPQKMEDLISNPRFQKILEDPALLEAIEKKDFTKIISNPKIMELSNDPAFILKALRLQIQQDPSFLLRDQ